MSVSQRAAGAFRISVSVGLQNNDVMLTEPIRGFLRAARLAEGGR
jgi:hypothetical protein